MSSTALLLVLALLNVLNVADALLTRVAMRFGVEEASPIMRLVIQSFPEGWMTFKVCTVAAASILLVATRRHRLALAACAALAVVYLVVVLRSATYMLAMGIPL